MQEVFYFGSGPAALPRPVLEKIRHELLDYRGTGLSVLELPHRSDAFFEIRDQAVRGLRDLLQIPEEFAVLFMHGGATSQFSMLPMNFLGSGRFADYLCTGFWSSRACAEAARFAEVRKVQALCKGESLSIAPHEEWDVDPQATYLHFCDNETIQGIAFPGVPQVPQEVLVCDMTSSLLMHPVEISKFSLIYASTQKNLGIAGLCLVMIRKDLLEQVNEPVPRLYDYRRYVREDSVVNTLPVFAIYVLREVLDWVRTEGGLPVLHQRSLARSAQLYRVLDESRLYENRVAPGFRSSINIPFAIHDAGTLEDFLRQAEQRQLLGLQGHRSAGGVRVSLYNAIPDAGVDRLTEFMSEFEARRQHT
ncbi:MAG: 3-phosphoserine/phosphohydroxythreonine transaminase [Proteobacteria bacterium]|nr:3-phosphoserine/phosphohydroxythreonine transaminase [Pseudomonadota bacterium]